MVAFAGSSPPLAIIVVTSMLLVVFAVVVYRRRQPHVPHPNANVVVKATADMTTNPMYAVPLHPGIGDNADVSHNYDVFNDGRTVVVTSGAGQIVLENNYDAPCSSFHGVDDIAIPKETAAASTLAPSATHNQFQDAMQAHPSEESSYSPFQDGGGKPTHIDDYERFGDPEKINASDSITRLYPNTHTQGNKPAFQPIGMPQYEYMMVSSKTELPQYDLASKTPVSGTFSFFVSL